MKNYKDLITISLKKNYRNSTNFQKNFIILYKSHRNNLSKKIIIKQTVNNKIKKNDLTFNQIKDLYENKYNKNKERKILLFHKKFEVNLKLKKKYNTSFKKLSEKETSTPTYCYLGLLIYQSRILNKFQKINCILKIIDKVTLNEKDIYKCNYLLLSKLILLEKLIIKKIMYAN